MTEEPIVIAEEPTETELRDAKPIERRERRYKRIAIEPYLLFALLRGKVHVVDLGIPADAELVGCGGDYNHSVTFTLIVEHPSFPSVPEGEYVPLADPILWLQS